MARILKSFTCQQCGKVFEARRKSQDFCSRSCKHSSQCGDKHWNWKGGATLTTQGYVRVAGGRAAERTLLDHRMVVEKALGHPLPPGAVVHHWDDDGTNNTPSNLVICQDQAYHMLLHARKRRLEDTGSLDLKRCRVCGHVKPLSEFHGNSSAGDKKSGRCAHCDSLRSKARWAAAKRSSL
jgi:HNH endonuclease